ncbi:MAG: outer membrane beta-barrel protein [Chlorobi bacterium]|nr:outer membrane beta-barrel protein [Chlorobiota bacterium]MCI0715871.1 outer membrane beta-barrel protein [Chlorobiota bacterium]
MKSLKCALCIFFIAAVSHLSFSQVKISLGPSIGLTVPTGDYSGTTIDYYNGTKYGLSSGVNFGAVFKVKLPVVRIRAALNYSSLSNTGNSEVDKPNSFVEVKHSLFMISAGPEFSFNVPSSPVAPYAGIDLLFTSISGETRFQGVSRVETGTYNMAGASRLGVGIGAGVEFGFGGKYAVDLSLRYNFINLIGKKFEELSTDRREDSYVNLNDEQDPNYAIDPDKHPINNSRSISTFQFNLAFLFGL